MTAPKTIRRRKGWPKWAKWTSTNGQCRCFWRNKPVKTVKRGSLMVFMCDKWGCETRRIVDAKRIKKARKP
jgi:hypothetical protein